MAILGLMLGAVAITYAVTHFAMSTDTDQLLSKKLPYLQARRRVQSPVPP